MTDPAGAICTMIDEIDKRSCERGAGVKNL